MRCVSIAFFNCFQKKGGAENSHPSLMCRNIFTYPNIILCLKCILAQSKQCMNLLKGN